MSKSFEEQSAFNSVFVRVSEILEQYNKRVDKNQVFALLDNVVKRLIETTGKKRHEIVNQIAKSFNETSKAISEDLLISVAEERPGTEPFSHEANILVPLIFIFSLMESLSVSVKMAIRNEELTFALNLTEIIASLSLFLGENTNNIMPFAQVDISEIGKDGITLQPGPSIMLPQPALAYISRLMSSIISKLDTNQWKPNLEDSDPTATAFIVTQFQRQIDLLIVLRTRYGIFGSPSRLS